MADEPSVDKIRISETMELREIIAPDKPSVESNAAGSRLREMDEIVAAHDTLVGVLLNHELRTLIFDDTSVQQAAMDCASVLCWVLHHDHNTTFARNLAGVAERLEALGIGLSEREEEPAKEDGHG